MKRDTTWMDRPATIIWTPVSPISGVLAIAAKAPPMACRTREKKSEPTKIMM